MLEENQNVAVVRIRRNNYMKRVMLKDIKLGEVNHVAGFVETIRNKSNVFYCFKGYFW